MLSERDAELKISHIVLMCVISWNLFIQTEECKWFTLEEMKAALYEAHSLLGPEPVELATAVANMKGLTFDVLNVFCIKKCLIASNTVFINLLHDLHTDDSSDPTGPVNPVNSCIFAAVLYFPVFCTVLSCFYSFIHAVWSTWILHCIVTYLHQLLTVCHLLVSGFNGQIDLITQI